MAYAIYIIFLILVSVYTLFIWVINNKTSFSIDEGFSNESNKECPFGKDPVTIETSTDVLDCEKRIWSATDPKGWTCAAPIPTNKLKYDSIMNVKYHDTISDIKSQNTDVNLSLSGTNYYDASNNIFQNAVANSQNTVNYNGPGKYKYGYQGYVPQYHESVILSKLTNIAKKELKDNQKKLDDEYNLFTNNNDAYKGNKKKDEKIIELLRKNNINEMYNSTDPLIITGNNINGLKNVVNGESNSLLNFGIIYANNK